MSNDFQQTTGKLYDEKAVKCDECRKPFLVITASRNEDGDLVCPYCDSTSISAFQKTTATLPRES